MSLGSTKRHSELAKYVSTNYPLWKDDAIARLSSGGVPDTVLNESVAKRALKAVSDSERITTLDEALQERLEELCVLDTATSKKAVTRSEEDKKSNSTELTKGREIRKDYQISLRSARARIVDDAKAWGIIAEGLEGASRLAISGLSARNAYLALEKLYNSEEQNDINCFNAQREFDAIAESNDPSIKGVEALLDDHIAKGMRCASLEPDAASYKDYELKRNLMRKLPEGFEDIAFAHFKKNSADNTYNSLIAAVRLKITLPLYKRLHGAGGPSANNAANPSRHSQGRGKSGKTGHTSGSSSGRTRECWHCKAKDHILWSCKQPGAEARQATELAKKNKEKEKEKSSAGSTGKTPETPIVHASLSAMAVLEELPDDDEPSKPSESAMFSTDTRTDYWIVDSGCTSHFTHRRDWIQNYQTCKAFSITVASGSTVLAIGKGEVVLRSSRTCLSIRDVYYTPHLVENLLSVGRLTEHGAEVVFAKGTCSIMVNGVALATSVPHNRILCKLTGTDICPVAELDESVHCVQSRFSPAVNSKTLTTTFTDVEVLNQEVMFSVSHFPEPVMLEFAYQVKSNGSPQTLRDWHDTLGHLSVDKMRKMAKMVEGMQEIDFDSPLGACDSCSQGKLSRAPFTPSQSAPVTEALALVHSDLCGPFPDTSLDGSRYFMTLLDDYTGMSWVYTLRDKNSNTVYNAYVQWEALVMRASGKEVKILRTDGGTEYKGDLAEYFRTKGIVRQLTVRHTPEQNGKAERLNRTLLEKARCIIYEHGLPPTLWDTLIKVSCYLRNIGPVSTKDMVPWEAWTGQKVNVSHLRNIGTTVWSFVPEALRSKLERRAELRVLIGYSSVEKAYLVWDPTKRIVESAHTIAIAEERHPALGDLTRNRRLMPTLPSAIPSPYLRMDSASSAKAYSGEDIPADRVIEDDLGRSPDPLTVNQCRARADWSDWESAMAKEMASLKEKEVFDPTFDPTTMPATRSPIGSKWVFKLKRKANGAIDKYKARLVAQGYNQVHGLDYEETFSPVVRMESIRILFALAARNGLTVYQYDVVVAYLNAVLKEKIYMKLPSGEVVLIRKGLYGLKQSGREWNAVAHNALTRCGFTRCEADRGMYISNDGKSYLSLYVDDMLFATKDIASYNELGRSLSKFFEIEAMGPVSSILGVQVTRESSASGVSYSLDQTYYIESILEDYQMSSCKALSVPMDPGLRLSRDDEPKNETEIENMKKMPYRQLVGKLMYLVTCTRPDIAYAVSRLARFLNRPGRAHWNAAKNLLAYLQGTKSYRLTYSPISPELVGYTDSDFAGDIDSARSQNGFVFILSGSAILWQSQLQHTVATSTTEAEYVGMSEAAKASEWLRNLLVVLAPELVNDQTAIIRGDNQGAIALSKNPMYHRKTKHINTKYHFIRQLVEEGTLQFDYVSTKSQTADIFTKALQKAVFNSHVVGLGLNKANPPSA